MKCQSGVAGSLISSAWDDSRIDAVMGSGMGKNGLSFSGRTWLAGEHASPNRLDVSCNWPSKSNP